MTTATEVLESEQTFRPHPRRISWKGATALALGGSNQSIFLIGGAGGLLASQGSMAVPLLMVGLLLSYMATPGWIELSCMFPNRVGGIAATCAEAFRPYSAVLANLTGVCYWWGWVPTCGLTAIFSASAIQQWYLPHVSIRWLATLLVLAFTGLNMCGLRWAVRAAVPIAIIAATLALGTSLIPILTGHVDWRQASSFHLISPFHGTFGKFTSAMAGIYLVGFGAPAFEAAACHIGEMRNPASDQPKAMWTSGALASIYFVIIPVVWLGVFGETALQGDLFTLLGPTFAPLFGSFAKAAGIWFIAFNMFAGTIQPLSGASRTLSQLSEDGLLPRTFGYRHPKTDAPMVAIAVTAGASIAFLAFGDPTSVVAAANLTYLIGIALPSVAVYILRRNEPLRERPYRAHRWSINLGVLAAVGWLAATVFGFESYGLPFIIFGLGLAYSGSLLYAWRKSADHRRAGTRGPKRSIHLKLTGAMLLVISLDSVGYLVAVSHVPTDNVALVAILKDVFVAVALLTISVGLVLPGMIAHTATEVTGAARNLADGTLLDLTLAMEALAAGNLRDARANIEVREISVRSRDEFGELARSFNVVQHEAARTAVALDAAASELGRYREGLEQLVDERTEELSAALDRLSEAQRRRRELLDRMRELTTRIGVSSGAPADLGAAVRDTIGALGETLGVDEVMVQLADRTGRLEAVGTLWRRSGEHSTIVFERIPESFTDMLQGVATRHEELIISDVAQVLSSLDPAVQEQVQRGRVGGLFVCPIFRSDDVLLGVFALTRQGTAHHWTEDDVALVETVAADFGRAVVSAKLIEDQQNLVLELQDLDRTRSEMLSTFSHELRTPLASIRAYVELLREGEVETFGGSERMLEVIERNTLRLTALIEDVLTLSHLNAEVMEVELHHLDLDPLLVSVEEALLPSVDAKGVHLDFEVRSAPAQVLGDERQLERMAFNLISNAIKFTPRGGTVQVLATSEGTDVVLTVTDTGIGIPAEEQGKIFSRFYRGSNATRDVIPGTGLGLAITEAIVRHHGGSIGIESEVGKGTTVAVRLPVATTTEPAT